MSWLDRIFPRKIVPDAKTKAILKLLYPNIPWQKIRFYEGLPWFLSQQVSAIVLPDAWGTTDMLVYFKEYIEDSDYGKSIIVHEAYHIQQAFDFQKAIGLGWIRGFIVAYLGLYLRTFLRQISKRPIREWSFSSAYYNHPMELPAYKIQSEFYHLYTQNKPISPLITLRSQPDYPMPFFWMVMGFIPSITFFFLFPISQIFFKIIFIIPNIIKNKNK